MSSPLVKVTYRRVVPDSLRRRVFSARQQWKRVLVQMKMRPIQVEACLLGGENGASAATFARMSGDLLRASRPISEWPHVKLLREFEDTHTRGILRSNVFSRGRVITCVY